MFKQNDFDSLREEMVNTQLITRGIFNKRILEAFRKIPRHKFVPGEYRKSAYGDFPLPIGENQTISQPYIVALMTQVLEPKENDKILEIGTGSGYQTAILASLTKEVYTVERIPFLLEQTYKVFQELYINNITMHLGDGSLGWQDHSPYDKIIVTAAAPNLSPELEQQLNEGGKIVIPISATFSQVLTVFSKHRGKLAREEICGCTFVPLIGKHGYQK